MPKRDPQITEAAQCSLDRQHGRYGVLYGKLLKQHKATRLTRLIENEKQRLQRATA